MMDQLQFYPSTPLVVKAVWDGFENKEVQAVLDPEAGDGALLDPKLDRRWNAYRRCDAVEIDMERHNKLKEKGIQVVGFDFLDFPDASIYSHIVMNPPFAVGCQHLLHAWNILMDGEIGCVLNAETIRNPYSKERQQLLKIIADHGKVQFISNAFSKEAGAERKTDVEIAVVHLKKSVSQSAFMGTIIADMEAEIEDMPDDTASNTLAIPNNAIKNMVLAYRCAWEAKKSALMADARATYYLGFLGADRINAKENSTDLDFYNAKRGLKTQLFAAHDTIRERAWYNVLRCSDVNKLTTTKVQQEIEKNFDTIKKMAFTTKNIFGFLAGLAANRQEIQTDAVLEVFDLITRYHSDNRVYYMGWKSNDEHRRVGMSIKRKRFILPYFNAPSWNGGSFDTKQLKLLADIDLVFAMLDGKLETENSMVDICNTDMQKLKNGERVSSTYFDLRYYKGKGTVHFFPKSQVLLDRLNIFVGQRRQWLPTDMSQAGEAFRKQFDSAENNEKGFVEHLRKLVIEKNATTTTSLRDNLLDNNADSITESSFIGDAMSSFLDSMGYDTESLLENVNTSKMIESDSKPRPRCRM